MTNDHAQRIKENLGKRLKYLRKQKGMTLDKAAQESGLSKGTISNYETGKSLPNLENLCVLLQTYGATMNKYFGIDAADYKRDSAVFKRYGLSEDFRKLIYMSKEYGVNREIVDCLNLIFQYPLYTYRLFVELSNFFNAHYADRTSETILKKFTPDATKRLYLEPVVQILCQILDAKNPEQADNEIISSIYAHERETQADQFKVIQQEVEKAGD